MSDFGRRRLRLLTYVGRWGRARRWLPSGTCRVIDVGCAMGYGTAALASRAPRHRWIAGLERDPRLVQKAGRRYPWLPLLRGDAAALPIRNASVDAVMLLDVLEHVPNPAATVGEVHRILRPGGYLVLSVPHAGLLAGLDANNVYLSLRRRWSSLPPLDPYDDSAPGKHRHFSVDELADLLGFQFTIERIARTGLGLAELLHLVVVVTFRIVLPWAGAYGVLRYLLHFNTYLIEDCVPTGRLGYHVTLRARAA
jgi:SAM-dependent methyltransferase